MRLCARVIAVLAVSFFLIAPSANAQGYVTPSLGVVFGNPSARGQADFVVDVGWLSRVEPLGFELDVMYAPSFFGTQGPYGENSVTTYMANVVVAGGGGGRFGGGRRHARSRDNGRSSEQDLEQRPRPEPWRRRDGVHEPIGRRPRRRPLFPRLD
jgi:hypothetical protein